MFYDFGVISLLCDDLSLKSHTMLDQRQKYGSNEHVLAFCLCMSMDLHMTM